MEAALQIALRKLLREGTGKPCYVFAVVGRTCGYNLFNRVLQMGLSIHFNGEKIFLNGAEIMSYTHMDFFPL